MQIKVDSVVKNYKTIEKRDGLRGSIQSLFSRKTRMIEVIKGISFSIEKGECVGIVGANGAGKTTLIKMMTGLVYPTGGDIEVLGYKPWERKNEYKKSISLIMGNKFQLWWELPAIETFQLHRKIYDIPSVQFHEKLVELSEMLHVEQLLRIPVKNLSLGERMKMEIITGFLHEPEIIFLDEPTIGLDFESQQAMRKFLREYNIKHNATIILTSHYMKDIEEVCDRLIMISKGKLKYDGKKEMLETEEGLDLAIASYLKKEA